ncbi:MAG: helicase-associated domain-containing protein [Terriglobia bacterium]
MDDMASILAVCGAEPFRIRGDDYGLFARAYQTVASALGTLPEWVENQFNFNPHDRIDWALAFLKHYEFLKQKGHVGQDLRLELTETGRNWLGLAVKDRLRTLLDGLLGKHKKRTELFEYEVQTVSLLPYSFEFDSTKQDPAVRSAVMAAYAGHSADTFVSIDEFLCYHAQQSNPLGVAAEKHPHAMLRLRGDYVPMPSPDELEEAWSDLLRAFLRLRLVPLGAAKVSVDVAGAPCFALTEAGRYLVGAEADFRLEQPAGRIVVQPNFDVVFLAPAPRAEAEFSRFAERKGRHMGTLFRITKRSILAAAAVGLTLEQTFETLCQCCSEELPPNVRREISGWFAQCRRVSLRPAVLIHCPDAETAARIQAVAGSKVAVITDVILDLQDFSKKAELLRKIREAGIFISP